METLAQALALAAQIALHSTTGCPQTLPVLTTATVFEDGSFIAGAACWQKNAGYEHDAVFFTYDPDTLVVTAHIDSLPDISKAEGGDWTLANPIHLGPQVS